MLNLLRIPTFLYSIWLLAFSLPLFSLTFHLRYVLMTSTDVRSDVLSLAFCARSFRWLRWSRRNDVLGWAQGMKAFYGFKVLHVNPSRRLYTGKCIYLWYVRLPR